MNSYALSWLRYIIMAVEGVATGLTLLSEVSTLLTALKEMLYGDKKTKCERLLNSVNSAYDLRKDEDLRDLHNLPVLQDTLKYENAILMRIKARLKQPHPKRIQIIQRRSLHQFLMTEEINFKTSCETIRFALETYRTAFLQRLADDRVKRRETWGGFSSRRDDSLSSEQSVTHGSKRKAKTTDVSSWMNDFFHLHGMYMIHEDKMLLKFCYRRDIYKRMVQELGTPETTVIKNSTFYKLWRENFGKYITLTEAKGELTQDSVTITITTMNPSDIELPQLIPTDENTQDLARLSVHLTGALFEDTSGKQPHIFRVLDHIPHDGNFIINCLLKLLVHHKEQLKNILLLQLCWQEPEMKKLILTFVSLLVDRGIFKQIYVRFCPDRPNFQAVENTLGCTAAALNKNDILCLDDLDRIVQISSVPNVRTEEIKNVFHIERWISPYLEMLPPTEDALTWFWFGKANGTVMKYRMRLEDPWGPHVRTQAASTNNLDDQASDNVCLENIPDIFRSIPEWVHPRDEWDFKAFSKDMKEKYPSKISQDAFRKWESFIPTLLTYIEVPEPPSSWLLQDLIAEG